MIRYTLSQKNVWPYTNVVAFLVVTIMAVPILLAHYLSQDNRGE